MELVSVVCDFPFQALSHSPGKHLLASSFLSIYLSACITAAPTRRISLKFDIGAYMKICQGYVNLVKIGQKYRELYMNSEVCCTVASDIKSS